MTFFHLTICLRDLSLSVYINHHSFNCCVSIVHSGHNLFHCSVNEIRNGELLGCFPHNELCYKEHPVHICTHLFCTLTRVSIFQGKYLEVEFQCYVLTTVSFSILEILLAALLALPWENDREWAVDIS